MCVASDRLPEVANELDNRCLKLQVVKPYDLVSNYRRKGYNVIEKKVVHLRCQNSSVMDELCQERGLLTQQKLNIIKG